MRRKIGFVPVDSGQVMIIDPCYVLKDKGDYDRVGEVTLSDGRCGNVKVGSCQGVASCTAYGDGVYPVYANYNKDGVITSLTIEFA